MERNPIFWRYPANYTPAAGTFPSMGIGWEDKDSDFVVMNELDVYAFYNAVPLWEFDVETEVFYCDAGSECSPYATCYVTPGGIVHRYIPHCPGHIVEILTYTNHMRHQMRLVELPVPPDFTTTTEVKIMYGCMEGTWAGLKMGVEDWLYYFGTEQTFDDTVNTSVIMWQSGGTGIFRQWQSGRMNGDGSIYFPP